MTEPESPSRPSKPLVEELADAVRLREGADGVTRALWLLHSERARTSHDWSRALGIPVPVLAALRKELEKRHILQPESRGLIVTDKGKNLFKKMFGGGAIPKTACPHCGGSGAILPPGAMPLVDEFEVLGADRPEADPSLDQSHATAETAVRKALFLLERGWLGRFILFLGDDDLISVACRLVRNAFQPNAPQAGGLVAADVDARYLDFIREVSGGEIETIHYDVREELPDALRNRFGAVVTDPAYTVNGITAFAMRARGAAAEGGALLLSMPPMDPASRGAVHKNLIETGWVLREMHERFNRYKGASIHAHTTNLSVWEPWPAPAAEPPAEPRFAPFYTGEVRDPGAEYRCAICETPHRVGPGREYPDIRALKAAGCSECGGNTFRRMDRNA